MTSRTESGTPRMHPLVLVGLACGPFISMVDSNAVNVALPAIAGELETTVSTVGWIVGAYLLGIGAFLPAAAWFGDRFGTRRVYMASLAAFGATSAACVFAPSIEALIALRGLQGAASAPMIPLALALLFAGGRGGSGGKARPPMAAGLCFFLAPALGPSVGGVLVEAGDWRWIFLVNVPLVAVGLLASLKVPRDEPRAERRPLDGVGMLLLAAGATGVVLSSSIIPDDARLGWAIALVGVDLLLAYIWWQLPLRRPALSLGTVKSLRGALPVAVSVAASLVLFAVLFLIPIFMMQIQGHSAIVTGLVLLPQGLVMGICTGIGEKLAAAVGMRATVGGGMVVLAGTTALMLLITTGTPPWLTALLLAGRGVALGLTLQPIIMGTLGRVDRHEVADVSTLFNVVQRLGGSLGVAGFAAFYQLRMPAEQAPTAVPFHETVWLMTAVALLGALMAAFLPGRARRAAEQPAVHAAPDGHGSHHRPDRTVPDHLEPTHNCPHCNHPIAIADLITTAPNVLPAFHRPVNGSVPAGR